MFFFYTILFFLLVVGIALSVLGLFINLDPYKTAAAIRRKLRLPDELVAPTAIILGTGWGDTLVLENERSAPLSALPGFRKLSEHPTHKRRLCFGYLAGRPVFVLRGRVHLNEAPHSAELARMARLQVEMLCVLGVEKFVLTAAVGGLLTSRMAASPSDQYVCVIDGFVTVFAPEMPLYAGEHVNPEDALDPTFRQLAVDVGREVGLKTFEGGHVMVRGPFFEGRKYDKIVLTQTGADVVGMSILPEACVAAIHNARVLALGFVSNDAIEPHSDELVRKRTKAAEAKLDLLLHGVVFRL